MSTPLTSQAIKVRARELGFAACGVARAEETATHEQYLRWLENEFHADMNWIAREDVVQKRKDVRHILPDAKSVICVAMHYRTESVAIVKRMRCTGMTATMLSTAARMPT